MSYRRVPPENRLLIKAFLDIGLNQSEIADKLGFHKSTISRELRRNRGARGYRIHQANQFASVRQNYRFRPRKMNICTIDRIITKLRQRWSPEAISHRLRIENLPTVSAETIYRFIYQDARTGGILWRYLTRAKRRRKPRFPKYADRRGKVQNALSIHDRPLSSTLRNTLGHWKRDTMVGKNRKTGILVLTDRQSRFNVFRLLSSRKARVVTQKTIEAIRNLPVKSIINDRGHEFHDVIYLKNKMGLPIYFCDPYSPHQRGSNENRIGVLRRYFPKGTDVSKIHWKHLKYIENEMNHTPIKCLDWKTPYEVMTRKSCTTFV